MGIFLTVALAHFLALLSPGPDFLLIIKSTIKNKPKKAMGVVLGITIGNAIYIILCIMGVAVIFSQSIGLMIFLKLIGGLFLFYIGYCAIKAKKSDYTTLEAMDDSSASLIQSSFCKEFLAGFVSAIFNPKNLLFYLSLFTVVLLPSTGMNTKILLGIWMTTVVFMWDAFIVLLLSRKKIQNAFNQIAYYIDKCAGVILGLVGVKVLFNAVEDIHKTW